MTGMRIHTPQERAEMRQQAEAAARRTMVEWLCVASLLRTALTRVLPLAGSAGWWVALLALLPGMALCLLAALALRLTGAETLMELSRRTLGRAGACVAAGVIAALLLWDAAASLTALTTLFTQGVGARGTPFTLAVLTCGAAALCVTGNGLPRATTLLRWPLLAAGAAVVLLQAGDVRLDRLVPLRGEGFHTVSDALSAGAGMAWPMLLLLTVPKTHGRPRLTSLGTVTLATALPVAMLCLIVPHDMLRGATLAGALMLPARFAPPAGQVLTYCMELAGFFLAIASAVSLAAEQIGALMARPCRWTGQAALLVLALSQALDARRLWQALSAAGTWLLLPLAGLTAAWVIRAVGRGSDA